MIALVPLAQVSADAVEQLLDRAFGADRLGRTAYRIRQGTEAIPELSFAAVREDNALAGTIQCWPVTLACDGGDAVPMTMVGPVAVEPRWQHEGVGRALMQRMLDAAAASPLPGADTLMLIGDPEYYGRFFGFSAAATRAWRLPGPYEPHRLLARGTSVPDCAGHVVPRVAQPA